MGKFPSAQNTVFKRYNTALLVAFFVIIFIALSVASIRYVTELKDLKKQSLVELNGQAQKLNSTLETSIQTITSIQEYGQYILDNGSEFNLEMPRLKQEKDNFYLDIPYSTQLDASHDMHGNITGIGEISQFSIEKQQEIAMANLLLPSFITGKKVLKEANWFFYVSLQQFVNIHPWISRDSWHYTDRFLTIFRHNILDDLVFSPIKLNHSNFIWSPPYVDAAGTGMNTSLGAGLYRQEKLLGAVMIDIDLSSLQNTLSALTSPQQSVVLYNDSDEIFLFKQFGKEALASKTTWGEILPKDLKMMNAHFLSTLDQSSQKNGWLIEQDTITVTGWKLVRFQSYDNFSAPLNYQFIFLFALLFFGFLAFLILVNSLTRRSFIQPTQEFIEHIEYCAKGDPGKIKPSSDWLPWFYLVEDIFIENRSFFQQLKDQNRVLDSRVNEKTQALRESSEKHQRDYVQLRSVMNAIPELIIFNDPSGLLMGCNHEFELLTQYSEESMLGSNAHNYMPKALAKELIELNTLYDEHYPQQALIHAGAYIYQGYCNQFKNKQGEILGTIVILQDVTKQQETQKALELAKDIAEDANKVKIQFLANMSHEIRTPINAMQGMMELLEKTLVNSRQHHYLYNAQNASSSLLHLVNELLDLSKIEAGKMALYKKPVNLASLIDKAIKLNIGELQHKKLSFNLQISPEIPHFIDCDEMRLVQVISNLLNNAIKFTEKGEIQLNVSATSLKHNEVSMHFKVTDTGIGIEESKQVNLFKAFSQADESMTRLYGGSGLGLSICQQIVGLFGGKIKINSKLGQGSEFTFSLTFTLCPEEEKEYVSNIVSFVSDPVSDSVNDYLQHQPVTLCAINQSLSEEFIESINVMGWRIVQYKNLTELVESKNTDVILLISATELLAQITSFDNSDQSVNSSDNHWHDKIHLIALCQPAMMSLDDEIFDYLSSHQLSSMLLELPLYRYALLEINRTLIRLSTKESVNLSLNYSEDNKLLNKQISMNDDAKKLVDTPKALSSVNILLVEDNLVNQLVEEELLIELGAKVTIAENGEQAVQLVNKETFDVVLMDIQMPVMDGLTATKVIRKQKQHEHLPIIAMTAHARSEDTEQSLAAGMNLHIAKPVTSELLLSSITKVL